ncbi:phthiocerol/phthiodiolone dimycocerosyl transferase family protein [Nocardia brasiliensis]|uniref:phthiocerol/phthiodiolone dimycocerosyl transferase family protein n=1 Tax=Nocardia brasiliensis TaxID=37326 RepID=UPI003D8A8BA9
MDTAAWIFAQTDAFVGYTYHFAGPVHLPLLRRAFEVVAASYPILGAQLRMEHARVELGPGGRDPWLPTTPAKPSTAVHEGLNGTDAVHRLIVRRGESETLVTWLVHATIADFAGCASLAIELWGLYSALRGLGREPLNFERYDRKPRYLASTTASVFNPRRRSVCTFTRGQLPRVDTKRLLNLAAAERISLHSLVGAAALRAEAELRSVPVRELPSLQSISQRVELSTPAGVGLAGGIRLASFRAAAADRGLVELAHAIDTERLRGQHERHGVGTVTLAATSAAKKRSEVVTYMQGGEFPSSCFHPELAFRAALPEFSFAASPDASGLCLSTALRNFYVAAIVDDQLTVHRRETDPESVIDGAFLTELGHKLSGLVVSGPPDRQTDGRTREADSKS